MKTFFKWTTILLAVGVGTACAAEALAAGRRRMKDALGRAEQIADSTRAALEQTQTALHDARTAL
jgi:hypothetical protein